MKNSAAPTLRDLNDLEARAQDAWERNDNASAFQFFGEAANAGLESCMLNLGYFYDEGLGTTQDKQKAMYWYKRAYRIGNAAAASNVAILYRERSEFRLATRWFKKAAELGDGDAAVELATLYMEGKYVRRSKAKSARWVREALSSRLITEDGREKAMSLLEQVRNAL
jgi:TPR repeat protein